MRRLLLLPALWLAACADAPAPPAEGGAADVVLVGAAVPGGAALSAGDLIVQADALDGQDVVVEGEPREVCQKMGCWLTLAGADGQTVRVVVPKDEAGAYVFTFPTDASGDRYRIAGRLAVETASVEEQRHYAEDGGADAEALAAITEPERSLVLTATGAERLDA
ncbi:DUF4920 domain-containing protein [Rubrivirga sp. S365]|uniref:DUF4920 domain-containing protein n=1 Tax=Rubrivirga litoralis TaxID=3075598 RepID=A0ABU3BM91_9BACT|nr:MULTISPECIES: DUF4920 domain-containing protein [unclassified Rubrivirga]MDT0630350.1 DUF4920 domain-containing protein [Rubrivirga sp. F394]MDT7855861.1 DUF4920 domain-containing protein [Rubrivirga sp. S365]